ncbi:cell adhesion molecule CEACAM1-like isoform X2 [Macrotis lagotis]|uniref:cell adhesion molecule CEACAM1-like isoform X2 n=1 Tax=Macrotis lagotis TaxID=92651 RepID=UPI003D683A23
MKSPSEAPCSGIRIWKRFLITVSILCCCIQLTFAQNVPVRVVPNPPYGTVGSSITLDIQGFSGRALSYTWYRKSVETLNQIAVYIVLTGVHLSTNSWQKVLPHGSLLISNLTLGDTGDYIIQIVDFTTGVIETAQGHLSVYEALSKPTIAITNMTSEENMDTVSLTCQTLSQDVTFWWFPPKGSPAGDRMMLSLDNRILTIINVTREDQGPYQCEIRNRVSATRSDPFILNVTRPEGTVSQNPQDTISRNPLPQYPTTVDYTALLWIPDRLIRPASRDDAPRAENVVEQQ